MRRVLALIVVLAGASASASAARAAEDELAAPADAIFRRGNDAYYRGKYADAIEAYEQVAALGVRAEDLFYNLGDAYYKAGKLGPAIYNFERALELDPAQDDVQFNLHTARDAAKKKGEDRLVGVEGQPFWMRVVRPYTVGGLGWLFLGLYTAVFAMLIVLHFTRPGFLRVGLWAAFAFAMIATAGSGVLFAGRLYLAERVQEAIVLPDSVAVKDGPVMAGADESSYTTVFRLHAGLRVRVTEKDQDWVRVRLANGLEGWLRASDLGRL
jgi:tetratricopeptide (TPR) repeat protein